LAGEIYISGWCQSTLCLRPKEKKKKPDPLISLSRRRQPFLSDFVAKIPIYFVPFIFCSIRLPAYAARLSFHAGPKQKEKLSLLLLLAPNRLLIAFCPN